MKGAIIGYTAIIAILLTGLYTIYYFSQSTPISKDVTTKEGLLVSSEDFNFFILKMLNQSIEFISQRAAYDLALNGGFMENREVYWNYNYPQISDLRKNLENAIGSTLPSFYKKFDKIIQLEDAKIIAKEQMPLSTSKYFDVTGYANFSIYDETARSETFSNFNINSRAISSYFRLLHVAREILTNTRYNSSLNDANGLKLNLSNDFPDLNFIIIPSADVLDITIEDMCYPPDTYCLAPLNPDEPKTKIDMSTGQLIPYENLKLRFKIKAEQTGSTPSSCKFSISLNQVIGSVVAGNELDVALSVTNLGTTSDAVTLNAKAYNKITMTQDNTIAVPFDDNSKPIPYPTLMRIKTSSSTLGGPYLINVTGDGCTPNQEVFTTFDLTVNPSMTFSINVDEDPVRLVSNLSQYRNSTNVFVTKLTGVSENVQLSVVGLPVGVGYTLSQNNMPPNFPSVFSVLNLTTDGTGTTPQGDRTITIKGIGGGSYSEKQFTLHVDLPFDFNFYFQGKNNDHIFRTKSTSTILAVETWQGTPEPVGFSYDIVNSTGQTDPSNYQIAVQILPNPCPLSIAIPNCYPTMNIFTTSNTPADNYTIHVNAIATDVSRQISFSPLEVKWGCGDGIKSPTEQCDGTDFGGLSTQCNVRFPTLPPYNNPVRGGTLTCGNNCLLNTSNCIYCGNNKKEILPLPAEECDGTDASQCPGPGNCKNDCTCLTIFSNWQCSSFSGGTNVVSKSNYFQSPDCSAGWYPVSCASESAFPRFSNNQGLYGEDEIQKIIFQGSHCSVMAKDDQGVNEQNRSACVLCTNKQPTVLWGVTNFYNADSSGNPIGGGGIVNGWYVRQPAMTTGFAYVTIDSQACPLGPPRKYPISCLVDANESDQGQRDLLDDVYLKGGTCHATFRNNPEDNAYAFFINIGIVCTDKDFYQSESKIQWGIYSQGVNIADDVNVFATPTCSGSDMPISVFARNDHSLDLSNPRKYLDDVMQSTYISGQAFFVNARDTVPCTFPYMGPGNEQNRTIGILCAPSVS